MWSSVLWVTWDTRNMNTYSNITTTNELYCSLRCRSIRNNSTTMLRGRTNKNFGCLYSRRTCILCEGLDHLMMINVCVWPVVSFLCVRHFHPRDGDPLIFFCCCYSLNGRTHSWWIGVRIYSITPVGILHESSRTFGDRTEYIPAKNSHRQH